MNYLGSGIGLRPQHISDVLAGQSQSDWFEVISENLSGMPGFGRGLFFNQTLKVRERYPVALHGVSLNIGSTDPISKSYLTTLKELISVIEPCWVSDHLCWTGVEGLNLHDLMPLPYNQTTLDHVVHRIQSVQDYLGRTLVIENLSSYFDYRSSEMSEWEFLSSVSKRSGCLLLLDVNNIFVSSVNQQFDPYEYLQGIPSERVQQIHLAGPADKGTYLVDTHDQPVRSEVWELYEDFIKMAGPKNTLIERDGNLPSLTKLEDEMLRAKNICSMKNEGRGFERELSF